MAIAEMRKQMEAQAAEMEQWKREHINDADGAARAFAAETLASSSDDDKDNGDSDSDDDEPIRGQPTIGDADGGHDQAELAVVAEAQRGQQRRAGTQAEARH